IFGILARFLNRTFTEQKLRLLHRLDQKIKVRVKHKTMDFSERWIFRQDGRRMRVCIFRPKQETEAVPGILWLHGGGYAIGKPERAYMYAKKFMEVGNCVVVAPDFRSSVESPYPAALEDSYDALLWMKDHAQELGIRRNQLMVGGDSAGGGLTAALTLYARDKKEVHVAFQMPLYPMLDDTMATESANDNNAPVWNSKSSFNGWKLYLGALFGAPDVPCYAAAARAKDFGNLPPTATFVGDLEPFRDETANYVANLKKCGIPVKFRLFKGAFHAFDQLCPRAGISKEASSFICEAFKYASGHYYAEQDDQ
ncbi:MAG: alpha/beta hydrolase, partial [Clostridia bacterium]